MVTRKKVSNSNDVAHVESVGDLNAASCMEAARAYRKAWNEGRLTFEAHGHDNFQVEEVVDQLLDTSGFYPWLSLLNHPIEGDFDEKTWMWLRGTREDCRKCGQKIGFYTNGKSIKAIETQWHPGNSFGSFTFHDQDCKYASGTTNQTAIIDVPSGYLVLGNDLREYFSDDLIWGPEGSEGYYRQYQQKYNICNFAGESAYIDHHASLGMLTAYMGSGAVDVYASPTSIILGRGKLVDPENDEDTREKTIVLDGIEHHIVAKLGFDLWWYGAADFDRIKQVDSNRSKKINPPKKMTAKTPSYDAPRYSGCDLFRIPVEAGKWQMTHYGKNRRGQFCDPSLDHPEDENGITVISRLQKVG